MWSIFDSYCSGPSTFGIFCERRGAECMTLLSGWGSLWDFVASLWGGLPGTGFWETSIWHCSIWVQSPTRINHSLKMISIHCKGLLFGLVYLTRAWSIYWCLISIFGNIVIILIRNLMTELFPFKNPRSKEIKKNCRSFVFYISFPSAFVY
jgi:hypothetical protein